MSSCNCSTTNDSSSCGCSNSEVASITCPFCRTNGRKVTALTMHSQLKKEYQEQYESFENFNFCTNPHCSNVYYNDQGITIGQEQIKTKVTLKNSDPSTPLCYCKKLLKEQFYDMVRAGEPNIAQKIKEIIANGKSFCEKSNPKGVCCTEDVNLFLAAHNIDIAIDNSHTASCC